MAELGADVALITVRAQAGNIAATISQQLGVPVTIDIDYDQVILRVGTRRRSEQLERSAASVFDQITIGLGEITYSVTSGPLLKIVEHLRP